VLRGIFKVYEGNTDLQFAEGGNTVAYEFVTIGIKLFRPNYLINESVSCVSWPRGAVKNV
jgi:hypothetical protein